jgi:hypothetical protein
LLCARRKLRSRRILRAREPRDRKLDDASPRFSSRGMRTDPHAHARQLCEDIDRRVRCAPLSDLRIGDAVLGSVDELQTCDDVWDVGFIVRERKRFWAIRARA